MRLALIVIVAAAFGVSATLQQVYEPGNGVTMPILVKEVKPQYTVAAKDKKIQGSVLLRAVVLENGHIGEDVEVLTSLDADLDQQAVDALKQWEFKPGTRDGKPVAVRISCQLTFTLK
jgi:periplasmic protein TonB